MEASDDDVPLILTWDDVNSGLLSDDMERGDTERGDESKFLLSSKFRILELCSQTANVIANPRV